MMTSNFKHRNDPRYCWEEFVEFCKCELGCDLEEDMEYPWETWCAAIEARLAVEGQEE